MCGHCQILTVACSTPNGHQLVLDTMTYLRLKLSESVRFKMLVGMLNSQSGARFQVSLCSTTRVTQQPVWGALPGQSVLHDTRDTTASLGCASRSVCAP